MARRAAVLAGARAVVGIPVVGHGDRGGCCGFGRLLVESPTLLRGGALLPVRFGIALVLFLMQ